MPSDPGEQPTQRSKRGSRRTLALIVGVVALAGLGTFWFSRGPSTPSSPSPSVAGPTAVPTGAGPTAVPTLDFFRGRSYPTPTPQPGP